MDLSLNRFKPLNRRWDGALLIFVFEIDIIANQKFRINFSFSFITIILSFFLVDNRMAEMTDGRWQMAERSFPFLPFLPGP